MPEATHDLSTPGQKTVTRLVRPHCHIGPAYGGDRVKIDEKELKAPAVRAALWTEAERASAEAEAEAAREAAFAGPTNPISRAVDQQLEFARQAREEEDEKKRKSVPDKG